MSRPVITVGELLDFIESSKATRESRLYICPSLINEGEPEETQEFCDSEHDCPVVALEVSDGKKFWIGYKA